MKFILDLFSHTHLMRAVFFFPFFSPPFFRMLSQHISNVRPFCFVLFCFFRVVFLPPPLGHTTLSCRSVAIYPPYCTHLSCGDLRTATICYSPCSVHVGGTFLFSHASNQRKAFCHFCEPSDVTLGLEAVRFVPWKPERIHRRDSAPKTGRKTRFRSAESQRPPDLYCGKWPHSATCVCCSPANCLLLLWSRRPLDPYTRPREAT